MPPNTKGDTSSDGDWVGELLVGIIEVTAKGLFRFALRWPDTSAVVSVFTLTVVPGARTSRSPAARR